MKKVRAVGIFYTTKSPLWARHFTKPLPFGVDNVALGSYVRPVIKMEGTGVMGTVAIMLMGAKDRRKRRR
jgi:hypothetical protein